MLGRLFIGGILLCISASASEVTKYTHGIEIETIENTTSDTFPETQMVVRQDGKEVYRLSDYRVSTFYHGDLDGDGYEELVLDAYSGGAHCCFNYTVLELRPHMPKPYTFSTNNSDLAQIKKTKDKKVEIYMWDDRYSYFGLLCFACSPGVKVVAYYKDGRLRLDANRTKTVYQSKESNLTKSLVVISSRGNAELNSRYAANTIDEALHLFYTGETQRAILILAKYFEFEDLGVRKLFLVELVESMSKSPFWDDLRLINHWYDDVPFCYKKPCNNKELWQTFVVSGTLFEEITKAKEKLSQEIDPRLMLNPTDANDYEGYYALANNYYEGKKIKQNYSKALENYIKSCDLKYGLACLDVAAMYANGTGVAKSREKASEYFAKACDYGYAGGCKNWNIMNGYGPEVPKE